jgi:hypothetical protein
MNRVYAEHVEACPNKQPQPKQRPTDTINTQDLYDIQTAERPIIQFIHKLDRIMNEQEEKRKRPRLVLKLRNKPEVVEEEDSDLSDVPSDYCWSDQI